VNNWDSGQQG
jgi:hypothetical protein